jgi:hypothetical protein
VLVAKPTVTLAEGHLADVPPYAAAFKADDDVLPVFGQPLAHGNPAAFGSQSLNFSYGIIEERRRVCVPKRVVPKCFLNAFNDVAHD